MSEFVLGIDVGSSAVKVSLVSLEGPHAVAVATSPADEELVISAPHAGWAEQSPEEWWQHIVHACRSLREQAPERYLQVTAIGISYQEHGLVLLDRQGRVLRPAIIWCDSRTLATERQLVEAASAERWFSEVCNLPGTFTASKLAWVRDCEPATYEAAEAWLLPGDYIAYRMTGVAATTKEGLSEGMFYSLSQQRPATELLQVVGIDPGLCPTVIDSFGDQGALSADAAYELGLRREVRVTFRAGDQHANAVGLGVMEPGSAACAAGTSGVIFGVTDSPVIDRSSRINSFLHVTSADKAPRSVVVLCINAVGIAYSWLRSLLSTGSGDPGGTGLANVGRLSYDTLNNMVQYASIGAKEITVFPFGNGAERMLGHRTTGFSVHGVDFTRHGPADLARAVVEGIAFSFAYGNSVLKELGVELTVLRGAETGLLQSPYFRTLLASFLETPIEIYIADPAFGAAIGAAVGAGYFRSVSDARAGLQLMQLTEPDSNLRAGLDQAYGCWTTMLNQLIEDRQ